MNGSTMPVWIQYAQALGPTAVALIAGIIASVIQYRQWKLAHDRVRLDLFDRRLRVYDALTSEVMVSDGSLENQSSRIRDKLSDISGYRFLFPDELAEMIARAELTLMMISSACTSSDVDEDIHRTILNYFHEFRKEVDAVRSGALQHMKFDH